MKRLLRKSFVPLIVALAIFLFMANQTIVPQKLREFATDKTQEILNRKVAIGHIEFNPLTGFTVKQITISDQSDPQHSNCYIDELSFNILYLKILKERKFIIPSLKIKKLYLYLHKDKNEKWNFDDLLTSDNQKLIESSIIIGSLSIEESSIQITDESLQPAFSELLQNVKFNASLFLKNNIKFSIEAYPQSIGFPSIIAKGTYNYSSQSLYTDFNLKALDLAKYLTLYGHLRTAQMPEGIVEKSSGILTHKKGVWNLTSRSNLRRCRFILDAHYVYQGNPLISLDATYHPGKDDPIKLSGAIDFQKDSLSGLARLKEIRDIRGRLDFKDPLLSTSGLSGYHDNIRLELSGTLTKFADPRVDASIVSSFDLSQLTRLFPEWFEEYAIEMEGPAKMNLDYQGRLRKIDPSALKLRTTLSQTRLTTDRIPAPLESITGAIYYEDGEISWEDVSFRYEDIALDTNGRIAKLKDATEPTLIFSGKSLIDLAKIPVLFPEIFKTYPMSVAGKGDTVFAYQGLLSHIGEIRKSDFKISALLQDASFNMNHWPKPITKINGQIVYGNDSLAWINLQGSFAENEFTANGTLKNFDWPFLQTTLTSEIGQLQTEVKFRKQAFKITKCEGHLYDSNFSISGHLLLPVEKKPQFDLKGRLDVNSPDLILLFPNLENQLKRQEIKGRFLLDGSLRGSYPNLKNWTASLKISSKDFSLSGYHFSNLEGQYTQSDQTIHEATLKGQLYAGNFETTLMTALDDSDLNSSVSAYFEKIDLQKLKKDTIWSNENIRGLISGNLSLNGPLTKLKQANGKGFLRITNGHLWELDLLKDFGKFLLIPEYGRIVFQEAEGHFVIKDQRILTDDFELKSKPLTMICRGWLGFNKKLNFYLFSLFDKNVIRNSESLQKLSTTILTKTDEYLTIRLTGSLDDPHYLVVPDSVNVLRKTGDFILDTLQGIFE